MRYAAAADARFVDVLNAETIGGIKTFSDSPVVPTPTTNTQAANKVYVDDTATTLIDAAITGNIGTDGTFMSFNNLTIGKYYEISYAMEVRVNVGNVNAGGGCGVNIKNGTTLLAQPYLRAIASNHPDVWGHFGSTVGFTATSTSVTLEAFNVSGNSNEISGDGTKAKSWATLKECNTCREVSGVF